MSRGEMASMSAVEREEQRLIAKMELDRLRFAEIQALKQAERVRRSTIDGANVLVAASPSPKKKRAMQEDFFKSGPPSRQFYDSTMAGPPKFDVNLQLDSMGTSQNKSHHADETNPFLSIQKQPTSRLLNGLQAINTTRILQESRKSRQQQLRGNTSFEQPALPIASSSRILASSKNSLYDFVQNGRRKANGNSEDVEGLRRKRIREGKEKSNGDVKDNEVKAKTEHTKGGSNGMSRHSSKPTIVTTKVEDSDAGSWKRSRRRSSSSSHSINEDRDDHHEDENHDENEQEEDGIVLDITDRPKGKPKRRADGTLIEEIKLGPIDHKPILEDPNWDTVEPNSGIQLRPNSRLVSYDKLQNYLSDRYHLSPAMLYSLQRPQPNGVIEIDLDGDIVIIAVLAKKDEVRYMNPNALKDGDNDDEQKRSEQKKWDHVEGADDENNGEEEEKDEVFKAETKKMKTRRYIRFTLVDVSTEAAAASGTGTLTMMLFEAETEETIPGPDGTTMRKYRGGSGGAYEKYWKEGVGAVIAILNPKIMKRRAGDSILSITPESAESIMILGRSKDLRSCQALLKSGKRCSDWCDGRVNDFCSYHITRGVQRTGARRAETYSATSKMSDTVTFSKKSYKEHVKTGGRAQLTKPGNNSRSTFDHVNKTGLLPRNGGVDVDGNVLYRTGGTGNGGLRSGTNRLMTPADIRRAAAIESGNGSGGYVHGIRDGPTVKQAKKDKIDGQRTKEATKKELKDLMDRDQGKTVGGQYLKSAAAEQQPDKKDEAQDEENDESLLEKRRKKPFSAEALRLIGYDPTHTPEAGIDEDGETKRKRLKAIADLVSKSDRRKPSLAPPPGAKVRSGVVVPNLPDIGQPSRSEEAELPECVGLNNGDIRQTNVEEDEDDLDVLPPGVEA